jgi:hypothetical protein
MALNGSSAVAAAGFQIQKSLRRGIAEGSLEVGLSDGESLSFAANRE